ncbi:MAG: DNA repair protein RecN [Peptoniphilaceae bacterium]|nr:DNA repair protein RecN [Peptoniphilaceae bacterium]MDY6019389.1 DNA repair protein RecN [Anaerococcus sp.]
MLSELFIDNFVIIKRQHMFFENGFNVITGETGSGKSLILNAINLLLGKRSDKDVVGKFSDKTIIEGVFELKPRQIKNLEEKDISFDDNKLIITRTIRKNSSYVRINSRAANLSLVKEITDSLIDIYKQGDSSNFMDKKNYLDIIDSYSKDKETIDLRKELKNLYEEKIKLIEKYEHFDLSEEEIQREKELINYQIDDIREIDLDTLDEEALDEEYKKLNNITDLKEAIEKSSDLISSISYDSVTISTLLSEVDYNLSKYADFDNETRDFYSRLTNIADELDQLYMDLDSYKNRLDQDPERLNQLELLTQKIFDLKRKYGNTIDEIKTYNDSIIRRLEELDEITDLKANINNKISELDRKLQSKAKNLHEIRVKKSKILEEKIKDEIKSLNIVNAKFKILFKQSPNIGPKGNDDLDFLIRTNKGEDLKSLSKTASGGEISRIMLSFKKVFADFDDIDTLIFDEIDAGISGRTAQIVGEKILDLSKKRQIIAISHLPQIATLSNNHILISKTDLDEYTVSQQKTISGSERIDEIARLIGGVDITPTTIKSAKEMLEMAEELKNG